MIVREGIGEGEREEEREGDMLWGLSPHKPKMLATSLIKILFIQDMIEVLSFITDVIVYYGSLVLYLIFCIDIIKI